MPAYSSTDQALAVKLVTFYPQNTDVPTHNAIIAVFNSHNGIPEVVCQHNMNIVHIHVKSTGIIIVLQVKIVYFHT